MASRTTLYVQYDRLAQCIANREVCSVCFPTEQSWTICSSCCVQ